jgi:hypothetical protein
VDSLTVRRLNPMTSSSPAVGPKIGASLPALVALGPCSRSNEPDPTRSGNGFRTHFADDLAALASVGVTDLRLGFDWSRLEPRAGGLDGQWVEWYSDVITAAAMNDVRIWAVLLERAIPAWFDDEGGFLDTKAAGRRWPLFVEKVAEAFGDRVSGWFPIEDPIGFAARTEADDARRHGELVETLAVAWRDAWRILHGGPPIATSLTIRHVRPDDASPIAVERAQREDHLRFRTFLHGLRDGTVVVPGRADRQLADLAGAVDVIGIKMRSDLGADSTIDDESLRRWQERAQTLIHRVVDDGPDRPLAVIQRVNRRSTIETSRDAEVLTEAFVRAVDASRSDGVAIDAVFVEPGISTDRDSSSHALLDWNRRPTTVMEAWHRRQR